MCYIADNGIIMQQLSPCRPPRTGDITLETAEPVTIPLVEVGPAGQAAWAHLPPCSLILLRLPQRPTKTSSGEWDLGGGTYAASTLNISLPITAATMPEVKTSKISVPIRSVASKRGHLMLLPPPPLTISKNGVHIAWEEGSMWAISSSDTPLRLEFERAGAAWDRLIWTANDHEWISGHASPPGTQITEWRTSSRVPVRSWHCPLPETAQPIGVDARGSLLAYECGLNGGDEPVTLWAVPLVKRGVAASAVDLPTKGVRLCCSPSLSPDGTSIAWILSTDVANSSCEILVTDTAGRPRSEPLRLPYSHQGADAPTRVEWHSDLMSVLYHAGSTIYLRPVGFRDTLSFGKKNGVPATEDAKEKNGAIGNP